MLYMCYSLSQKLSEKNTHKKHKEHVKFLPSSGQDHQLQIINCKLSTNY